MSKSNRTYGIEDSFKKIESLLDDCLKIDNNHNSNEPSHLEPIVDSGKLEVFHGCLELSMDFMKMQLILDLQAPINSPVEIEILDIKSKIEEFGPHCESCVDWVKVNEFYTKIMFDGEMIPPFIIASGKAATFHVLEYIDLKPDLIHNDFKIEENDGKVDYHHINSLLTVAKNEFIGKIIPEVPGTIGCNLIGEEIQSPIKRINYYTADKNVVSSNGKLYSAIDGAFKIVANKLIIDAVLDIPGNVDYETGDIEFKGDVHITKTVKEGFSISSKGDLIVDESIEPTNITCGNNLTVKNGIFGNAQHNIFVTKDIVAKHISNAKINCLGSIVIPNGITNAEINVLGSLDVGRKSSIIGGIYRVQNGIVAGNIGNEKGKQSNIYLGMDFTVQDKILKTQETIIQLVDFTEQIQDRLRYAKSRDEKDKIKLLFLTAKNRLNSLNNYTRSLLYKLDKNENSTLTVWGKIKPRTYIEICHISCFIDEELSRVKFSLDKENGSIRKEFF